MGLKKMFFGFLCLSILSTVPAFANAPIFINISTASTSGSYYPAGIVIGKIWEKDIPNAKASVQTSGGSVHNIQLMANEEANIGFMDGTAYSALHAEGRYKGKPQPFIRAIAPLFPETVKIVIAKNSGIKSLEDLKGKRVSIGAVASGTEVAARNLLSVAEIDIEKDIIAERLSVADTAKAFMDKRIDAAIFVGALGIPGMVEITTLDLVYFIDIPKDIIDKVLAITPAWRPFELPANTYKGQEAPVQCYASWSMLTVHESMPDELVYAMTKSLYDNKDELVLIAPHLKTMDFANLDTLSVPLHPGAKKYYQEVGAIK